MNPEIGMQVNIVSYKSLGYKVIQIFLILFLMEKPFSNIDSKLMSLTNWLVKANQMLHTNTSLFITCECIIKFNRCD